jgi:hypothetical protein
LKKTVVFVSNANLIYDQVELSTRQIMSDFKVCIIKTKDLFNDYLLRVSLLIVPGKWQSDGNH